MIELLHVKKKFQKTYCLDGINLTLKKGERIAALGANGAGKTTLIRAIMGYYHLDNGSALVDGFSPVQNRVEMLNNISFIPQLPPPIKITLQELIEYAVKSSLCEEEKIHFYAQKLELDLEAHKHKSFFKLSGGMKQKALIAIALAKDSKIMIFDEPTANLDPKGRDIFYEMISNFSKDKTVLFITHRLDEIKKLVNRVIYMDLGKVVDDENL